MEEVRKRRYPTNRAKLYELRDRLEQEIAESQAALNDVRRLIREADNAAIINTARANNVTPEEFVELIKKLRSGDLNPKTGLEKTPARKLVAPDPKEETEDKTEETENE